MANEPATTNKPAASPPAPATVVATPQALNWDLAKSHLAKVEADMIALYSGKDGVNPYIWIAQKIKPIQKIIAVDSADRTPALYAAIMKIEVEEPTVDLNKPLFVKEVAKKS